MQDASKLDNLKSTILKDTKNWYDGYNACKEWNVLSEIIIGAKMNQ